MDSDEHPHNLLPEVSASAGHMDGLDIWVVVVLSDPGPAAIQISLETVFFQGK